MKKFVCIFLILNVLLIAAGLNRNANYIKKHYPYEYRTILKKHAKEKWDTNYKMAVFMVNNQANSLFSLIQKFKPKHTNIAFEAIQKWSYDGYKQSNIKKLKKLETFNLKGLIKLHCNWKMVEFTYDNQVEAKNAF